MYLNGWCVLSLLVPGLMVVNAAKYTVFPNDETIFKPCEGEEAIALTTIFDLSDITYDFVSDEEVVVDGLFKSIADVKKTDTLWIDVKIMKEVRGQYIISAAEIKRDDLCKAVFNPAEIWYTFTSKMDPKYRVCPCATGTVYGISKWSTKANEVLLPDSNLSGNYRAIIRGGVNNNPAVNLCTLLDFQLFLVQK